MKLGTFGAVVAIVALMVRTVWQQIHISSLTREAAAVNQELDAIKNRRPAVVRQQAVRV